MANICTTTLHISGEEENVSKLFKLLKDIDVNESMYIQSNDLFDCMGTPENQIDDYRSSVFYYSEEGLIIDIESAWSEPTSLINQLSEKFDVIIKWYAEEPGSCYYITNDGDFEYGKYILIACGEEEIFHKEKDLVESINNYIDDNYPELEHVKSLEDAQKKEYKDNEICAYEYLVKTK